MCHLCVCSYGETELLSPSTPAPPSSLHLDFPAEYLSACEQASKTNRVNDEFPGVCMCVCMCEKQIGATHSSNLQVHFWTISIRGPRSYDPPWLLKRTLCLLLRLTAVDFWVRPGLFKRVSSALSSALSLPSIHRGVCRPSAELRAWEISIIWLLRLSWQLGWCVHLRE